MVFHAERKELSSRSIKVSERFSNNSPLNSVVGVAVAEHLIFINEMKWAHFYSCGILVVRKRNANYELFHSYVIHNGESKHSLWHFFCHRFSCAPIVIVFVCIHVPLATEPKKTPSLWYALDSSCCGIFVVYFAHNKRNFIGNSSWLRLIRSQNNAHACQSGSNRKENWKSDDNNQLFIW